jgi:hypothetical protein
MTVLPDAFSRLETRLTDQMAQSFNWLKKDLRGVLK